MLRCAGPLRILILGCEDADAAEPGLGTAVAEAVGRWGLPGVVVESASALTIEHAALVAAQDIVIFVRPGDKGCSPFAFRRMAIREDSRRASATGRTSRKALHSVSFSACNLYSLTAQDLMSLVQRMFRRSPDAYVLTICEADGCTHGRADENSSNLAKAVRFLEAAIRMKLAA